MTLETLTIIIIIGLAAGILGGMIGIGGGLVIVPALIYFMAYSQKEAQGTSLGLLLLPVGILGVINYYKKGYVDLKVVGLLSIGFVVGSYLGSKWALTLPQSTLKKIFAGFLLVLAIKMLFIDKK
ncbi:MAG TPA: sulfite exporter TauE/SafE family protein [Chitinophagaceae bacterium]|nr:sulfite exporter TauE/SafE family protein [Chitinophagaceae bacterium]